MQAPRIEIASLFVDEAGDPSFYGKGKSIIVGNEGCSRTLMLGFIEVRDVQQIRDVLGSVRASLAADKYLASIPSVSKSLSAFHAKDDCPEVRMMIYKALSALDFSAHVVVARKIEPLFRQRYGGRQDRFYDDLITRLFQDRLHLARRNVITFSHRGNKTRQHSLRAALELAKQRFQQKWKTEITSSVEVLTSQPRQEPALQAIDYAMWAVQRAFERGEMRYFEFLRDKFALIHDVFDAARYKAGQNYYTRTKNPFDIKKISPLG